MPRPRRGLGWRVGLGAALLGAAGLVAVAARGAHRRAEAGRLLDELGRARCDLDRGDLGPAAARLERLRARWPGRGDVGYYAGLCAERQGRADDALDCWRRVGGRSPFAALAAFRRAPLEAARGRLADAERSLLRALAGPATDAGEARTRLAEVYWTQGRFDEVLVLVEACWEGSDPAEADRLLAFALALGLNPLPVDRLAAALDGAGAQSPDDDRVWLGRANLATLRGEIEAAGGWLDRCEARRPRDPAVARARLDWGLTADRPGAVAAALALLPPGAIPADRVETARARLAAARGDSQEERRCLERAVGANPGLPAALERLAELAARDGRADVAAGHRARKAELDEAVHRYRTLFRSGVGPDRVREMARLAERLGRRFEARGLWAAALRSTPDGPEARAALARLAPPTAPPQPAVAEPPAPVDAALTRASAVAPAAPAPAAPRFRDDAEAVGLTFTFDSGASRLRQLPEVMSGGVGLLDFDGDGWLDVYCVQGGPFPPDPDAPAGDRLFRNKGDGTFADVTQKSGIAGLARGYGHGVAVADFDNDGRPDLFVTRWGAYALYRNRGDGTFEDATEAAGLGGPRDWPTSAAFADLDGDGDLDLYVCHYLAWDPTDPLPCRSPTTGRLIPCDPRALPARPDHLFRNDGGRFVDVTEAAGIDDRDGRGLGVVAADLDDDGRVDLFVANDGTANDLFRNRGGMRFEEVGHASGLAAAAEGGYRAGMGVAVGDADGDGRVDLAVTNFLGESTALYRNLGGGTFTDGAAGAGVAAPSRYLLGFGAAFLDADGDGYLDLLTANGHVADERPEVAYRMPAQLLLGAGGGRFTDASARAGDPFRVPRLGRGLAAGDLDNDGRVDALIVSQDEPLAYLHNRTEGGHAVTLRLEGRRSNRDAVGARVTLRAGGRTLVAVRYGGGSYQSAGDPRLHFGLGGARRVDEIEVRWPSGAVGRYTDLPADAGYRLVEGSPRAEPLRGWAP